MIIMEKMLIFNRQMKNRQTLDQILTIIRSVIDDEQKLERILEFLENEIHEEEEDFEEIEVPEKFKPYVAERLKNTDKLKNKLFNALNNRKPFANFKDIIDNSDHRQDWFDFKFRWLENSVGIQLMEELKNL